MTDQQEVVEENGAPPAGQPEALPPETPPQEPDTARLEQTIASQASEIAALKQETGETAKKLAEREDALAKAVASYKALVIKSNPGVLADLITGNTIDEVDASLKNARLIIDRVRQEMEAEASRVRVPAGAPQRVPPDLSVLSPREKIQYAIGGKK